MGGRGLKSGYGRAVSLLRALREDLCLLFSSFERPPAFLGAWPPPAKALLQPLLLALLLL